MYVKRAKARKIEPGQACSNLFGEKIDRSPSPPTIAESRGLAEYDMNGRSAPRSEGSNMERKAGSSAAAVTADEVKGALGRTRTLSSEEEKALRMRYGAKEAITTALPQAANGNAELQDELLLIEMQLHRAWKLRQAGKLPAPAASRTKDKIVRALRKKR
jgi:hypothetical protein